MTLEPGRDGCQFCLGTKGGVKGNENVFAGVVVCDYCTVLVHAIISEADSRVKELEGRCDEMTRGTINCSACREQDSAALASLRAEIEHLRQEAERSLSIARSGV